MSQTRRIKTFLFNIFVLCVILPRTSFIQTEGITCLSFTVLQLPPVGIGTSSKFRNFFHRKMNRTFGFMDSLVNKKPTSCQTLPRVSCCLFHFAAVKHSPSLLSHFIKTRLISEKLALLFIRPPPELNERSVVFYAFEHHYNTDWFCNLETAFVVSI